MTNKVICVEKVEKWVVNNSVDEPNTFGSYVPTTKLLRAIESGVLSPSPAPAEGVISTVTNCPTCGAECTVEGKTTHYYVPRTAPSAPWIPVSERLPERNSTVFYWHKGPNGGGSGWPAIADEWRDEHHLDYATHWMPLPPTTPTTNTREGM